MSDFEEYIYKTIANAVLSWDDALAQDVYALGFFIMTEDDDLRKPTLRVHYNTHTQWEKSKSQLHQTEDSMEPNDSGEAKRQRLLQRLKGPMRPTSSGEAKWNLPFWIRPARVVIGTSFKPLDQRGVELRRAWIEPYQLWYDDELEESDDDEDLDRVSVDPNFRVSAAP